MHIGDHNRAPLSPQEGWMSDGRQVLEVTLREVMPSGEPPLPIPPASMGTTVINLCS